MASVNKIIIIGKLGRDPESKQIGDRTVCEFSVATDESWTDSRGEKQRQTDWHRVVVWGKTAENAAKYLAKGSQVYVEGSMRYREWTDKDGNKRTTAEIQAQNITFLDRKPSEGGGQQGGGGGGGQTGGGVQRPQGQVRDSNPDFIDDAIPF